MVSPPVITWRKSKIGISLGEVVIGLGLKILKNQNLDVCITVARMLTKASQKASYWGFKPHRTLIRHNNECSITFCMQQDIVEHHSKKINDLVEGLWNKKQDFTGKIYSDEELVVDGGLHLVKKVAS